MIKKVGVLTSGGDAPGMNCAVRAVVRTCLSNGIEVFGIYDGYAGLHANKVKQLDHRSVSDIINRGGTILGTARFPDFKEEATRKEAIQVLEEETVRACDPEAARAPPVEARTAAARPPRDQDIQRGKAHAADV